LCYASSSRIYLPTHTISSPPLLFFFHCSAAHRALHSFPTRRSSDLHLPQLLQRVLTVRDVDLPASLAMIHIRGRVQPPLAPRRQDRKSTRLNSSHVSISYAVFCLKKKKKK